MLYVGLDPYGVVRKKAIANAPLGSKPTPLVTCDQYIIKDDES